MEYEIVVNKNDHCFVKAHVDYKAQVKLKNLGPFVELSI